jgi:hypothetical protein
MPIMANLQHFVVKTQHQQPLFRKITAFGTIKSIWGLTIARKSLKISLNTQETQCVHFLTCSWRCYTGPVS